MYLEELQAQIRREGEEDVIDFVVKAVAYHVSCCGLKGLYIPTRALNSTC